MTVENQLAAALQLHKSGHVEAAEELYRAILEEQPAHADALHLWGLLRLQRGDAATAESLIRDAIAASPDFADYHNNLATVYCRQSRFVEAEAACREAIRLRDDFAEARNNLGNALSAQGRYEEALTAYNGALRVRPAYPLALTNAAHAWRRLQRPEQAVACCRQALAIDADSPAAWNNLGDACLQLGRFQEALQALQRAQQLNPASAEIANNLGTVLQKLNRWKEAVPWHRHALQLQPDFAAAQNSLGVAYRALGDWQASEDLFRRAVQTDPRDARAQNDLGELLYRRDRHAEAVECFRKAIAAQPELAAAHFNLGNAYRDAADLDAAEQAYRQALDIEADLVAAMTNLAITLSDQGRTAEACTWFARAADSSPADPNTHSHLLVCSQYLTPLEPEEIRAQHERWNTRHAAAIHAEPISLSSAARSRPFRVGFLSRDLRQHPVAFVLVGLLESLDDSLIESVCLADHSQRDAWTERLQQASGEWHEVAGAADAALADRIRALNLHVLFDLAGHTAGHRLLTFARRAAPVQVSWLGYVGTTGLTQMDVLLSDRYHTPAGVESQYCEQIVRMPDGYACYMPPSDGPPVGPPRSGQGADIVFGCFNNPAKISDTTLQLWAPLLRRLPSSRLFLKYHGWQSRGARESFLDRWKRLDLDPLRVEFAGPAPHRELLENYARIDIALDTQPYSGGLTTCEALWMGVPVVTLPGATFASRHALSYLTNAGVDELVAATPDEYIEMVASLTQDRQRLAEYRTGLRERVEQSRLCDHARFARNFEQMIQRLVQA